MEMSYRESSIKYVLPNLRHRWPLLKDVDDNLLAELYENFSVSQDAGNNDEKFPEWVKGTLNIDLS
jgi:hypothetical protein